MIDRVCKNKDDCARDLIKDVVTEMQQRQYNYSVIINDVQALVAGPPLTPGVPTLSCYDANQNAQQCGSSSDLGSCVISHVISDKKVSSECDTILQIGNAYISIYQSHSGYASFEVHCNRSLCNSHTTLERAKEMMLKYNVTETADGRLDGSRLMISASLMIAMALVLFFHQF